MKKEYKATEFEAVRFESEDVITNSVTGINEKTLIQDSVLICNF